MFQNIVKLNIFILIIFLNVNSYSQNNNKNIEIINTILSESNSNTENKINSDNNKISKKKKKKEKVEIPAAITEDMAILETGINLYNTGNYQSSINKLNELKTNFQNSLYIDQAKQWLAKNYLKINNPEKALQELEEIDKQSGEYPASLYLKANIYQNQKNSNKAKETFYKLASLFPEHNLADNSLIMLGKLFLQEKNGNNALTITIKLIKNYADRETIDESYFLLAKIFEKDPILKDMEKARLAYKKFIYKANVEKNPFFYNSPLLIRVKKDLKYLEKNFFGQ